MLICFQNLIIAQKYKFIFEFKIIVSMQKIAFVDRDGVINDDTGHYYVYNVEDVKLTEGLISAFKLLDDAGYKIVIVTNQGGIAKGIYTNKEVELIHSNLCKLLKQQGIQEPELYYCPHHESVELCLCKKPQGLLLSKALARFRADNELSFMIGDRETDLKAAEDAGIRGYKVETNKGILSLVKQIVLA